MTTLLRERGVRIYLWSNDHPHPRHVHAAYGECSSTWDLDTLQCIKSGQCNAGDLKKVRKVLIECHDRIMENWHAEWRHRERPQDR